MARALRTLVVALIGGAIAAGALLAFGPVKTETKPVVQQAPVSAGLTDGAQRERGASARDSGLTPHDIYKRDAPGVVYVKAQIVQKVQTPFDLFPQSQRQQATGSGFVIDGQGRILTNYHVISGASQVTVRFSNDKTASARVIGTDPSNDLALLKVDAGSTPLHPLALGNSDTAQVGDPVLAIGNPFGLDRTLTSGIVSAKQRQIQAPNGFSIDNVIQTDAAINPGNSGGPLLDAAGRVIGINSQIETGDSGSSGNVGIGFAVPINTAKQVLPDLERNGTVKRAYLGIEGATLDADLAGRLGLGSLRGALIQKVTPGGPAADAGLRGGSGQAQVNGEQVATGGDVIVKLDGKKITSFDQIVAIVSAHKPGDRVPVTYVRDGKAHTTTIKLAVRPARAPSS